MITYTTDWETSQLTLQSKCFGSVHCHLVSDKVFSLAVVLLSFPNLNELGNCIPEVCLGLEAITFHPYKKSFALTVQLANGMSTLSQFHF